MLQTQPIRIFALKIKAETSQYIQSISRQNWNKFIPLIFKFPIQLEFIRNIQALKLTRVYSEHKYPFIK